LEGVIIIRAKFRHEELGPDLERNGNDDGSVESADRKKISIWAFPLDLGSLSNLHFFGKTRKTRVQVIW
jgi:hypothetical protein